MHTGVTRIHAEPLGTQSGDVPDVAAARREACADDARGRFTVLTDDGLARLRAASPTHLRGVAEHAVGRLDEGRRRAQTGARRAD